MPLFTSELSYSDDYPTIEPSLKLDFANARALDPRITFERASTATYVGRDGLIKTAGEDEPRFDHDPETGESLGLLIEETRTNLIPHSQELNAATWNKYFGSSVSANYAIAPDGTQTADRIIFDGTPAGQVTHNLSGLTIGQQYIFSAWVKSDGSSNNSCLLYISGDAIQIIPTSEWKRIYVSRTATLTGENPLFLCGVANSLLVWGVQFEAGSFPTSYIPTSGSTATRAFDNAIIQGENFNSFFNPSEGSIICKYKKDHWPVASGNILYERVWEIGDGTDNNNINIFNDPTQPTGNSIRYRVRTSSTNVFGPTTITTGTNQTPTVALGYAKDNFVFVIDGTLVAADTSGDLPVVDRLHIGGRYGSDSFDRFNNTISKLFYYPKRITVAQLQTLTQ